MAIYRPQSKYPSHAAFAADRRAEIPVWSRSWNNLKTQGISLPKLGLGTFRMQGDACRAAVESALALGYRHIDTAEMYANEEAIGAAHCGRRCRAQRAACHDQGLARKSGAGCDPPSLRCLA